MCRFQRLSFCLFAVALIESASSTSALAYRATGTPWPGSPIVITYSYINMFDGGIKMPDESPMPNRLIRGSIEEALRVWAAAVPVNFVEVPDSNVSPAKLRFRHYRIDGPDPDFDNPKPKAYATCIGYGAACEVQYDDGDRWQEIGTRPQPDMLGATIHEVGHILGLDHSDVDGANMFWIFHRFSGLGTGQLFPDDLAGIHVLYGTGGSGNVTSLPEPGTLAMLFLALCGFALRRPTRRI